MDALKQFRDAVISETKSYPKEQNIKNYCREYKTEMLREILTSGKSIHESFSECSWIIEQLFPEIKPCIGFNQNNKYHRHDVYEHMLYVTDYCQSNKFEVKLAALLHDIGKPQSYTEDEEGFGHFYGHPKVSYEICKEMLPRELSLSDDELEKTLKLIREHDKVIMPKKKAMHRFLVNNGSDFIEDWLALKEADIADHINMRIGEKCVDINALKEIYHQIMLEEQEFKKSDLALNGKDIMLELGLSEGRQVGIILNALFNEVTNGFLENDREALLKYSRKVIHDLEKGVMYAERDI